MVYSYGVRRIFLASVGTLLASSLSYTEPSLSYSQVQTQDLPNSGSQIAQAKRRIAVLDFDFSSVSSPDILAIFPGVSKGTSELLVNELVKTNAYTVIERSRIDAILAEQNLGSSGRVDAATAAQIGRLLGVDAIILGSVTQFDVQQKNSGFSVGGLFGDRSQQTRADVQVTTRLVSSSTGEILSVAQGTGSAQQKDKSTVVLGIGGGSDTDNRQQLLTNATQQAVIQIAEQLTTAALQLASLPPALPSVTAVVADISGKTVILNKGSNDGYQPGMQVAIERVIKVVKDPQTGKVLRQVTQKVGLVKLTDVDSTSSLGTIVSGANLIVGDIGKPTQ